MTKVFTICKICNEKVFGISSEIWRNVKKHLSEKHFDNADVQLYFDNEKLITKLYNENHFRFKEKFAEKYERCNIK